MINRKYFPYERSNYYFGKLLTARDFEAEQRYFNDKRRLINRTTGANGVVAGLNVVQADDQSVVLQAGMAFDAAGREVVVPETQVVKLSTIEGYAQLTTQTAYLGISYDEQDVDKVYSAMREEGGGSSFNKIKESFKLTLVDKDLAAKVPSIDDSFVTCKTIYADSEIELRQYAPKYVVKGTNVAVKIELVKFAGVSAEYSFSYLLDTPGFVQQTELENGKVYQNHLRLSKGEKAELTVLLTPEAHIWGGAGVVTVTASEISVQKNDENFVINDKIESKLTPVTKSIDELALSTLYELPMDKHLGEIYDERLWIAELSLIRQGARIIIDSVKPMPLEQYSYNAGQMMLLRKLDTFFPVPGGGGTIVMPQQVAYTPAASSGGDVSDWNKNAASGVFDLPLGLGHSSGETIMSDEIMHGLGKGSIYVDIGVEYITGSTEAGEVSETIIGDPSVFAGEAQYYGNERVYNLSTAVKVLSDRGTFVVGVKLTAPSNAISVRVRWYAFKLNDVTKRITPTRDGERYILVNPDTIVLTPKATAHITPVFVNMPTEPCNYKLVDAEGGSIDNNGVYTAPAKEGVYEIRVEAISDPSVYTHVFAIVSQKKKS